MDHRTTERSTSDSRVAIS